MSDLSFAGLSASPNIHPLFVHFPVALWVVAVCAWVLWLLRPSDGLWNFGRWALRIGLLGAVAALITGDLAADGLGHDIPAHDLIEEHEAWMFWTSGLALLTAIVDLKLRHRSDFVARGVLVAMGVVTAVLLCIGADHGGELVFRYSVGTAGETISASEGHGEEHGSEPAH